MIPGREVVLDATTGLPEVVASLSDEGHLTFRVHTVKIGGGMSILTPIDDHVLKEVQADYGTPTDDGWSRKLKAVQVAYAKSIQDADESRLQHVEELTADVEALGKVINDERERADAAIARAERAERALEALRGQDVEAGQEPERKPVGRPRRSASPA